MTPETENLIRVSIVEDVMRTATAAWWRKRAEAFEWAKPRVGEYAGQSTVEDLRIAWRRCHDTAEACRQRAAVGETSVAA